MALLQIERGAFPRRGGIETTDCSYVERGSRQTVNYDYTETDTSITPSTDYAPTINYRQVCGAGDPIAFDVWLSNNIYPVSWTNQTAIRTLNAGTEWELSFTVLTSATAYANGQNLASFSFGTSSNSVTIEHIEGQDYHDYDTITSKTSYMIYDSNGQATSQCYITGARGALHGVFKRVIIESVEHAPGQYHLEIVGEEEYEMGRSTPLGGFPVVSADSYAHSAYNCEVSLSYT